MKNPQHPIHGFHTNSTPLLHALLSGHWTWTRHLTTGENATGTATSTPISEHESHFTETGETLLPDGHILRGQCAYTFRHEPHTPHFAIHFADPPHLFHELSFRPTENKSVYTATSQHTCGDDIYDSTYVINPNGTWQITHTVSGPRKKYSSETTYRPSAISCQDVEIVSPTFHNK